MNCLARKQERKKYWQYISSKIIKTYIIKMNKQLDKQLDIGVFFKNVHFSVSHDYLMENN